MTPLQELAIDWSTVAVQIDLAIARGADGHTIGKIAEQADHLAGRLWRIKQALEIDPVTEYHARNARRGTST
jgi:hypothetical protein